MRTHLLVQEALLSELAALLHSRWQADLGREGLTPVAPAAVEGEDPPCPACGTVAPLVQGACSDCGLVLE